jgi:hypothetical protein
MFLELLRTSICLWVSSDDNKKFFSHLCLCVIESAFERSLSCATWDGYGQYPLRGRVRRRQRVTTLEDPI